MQPLEWTTVEKFEDECKRSTLPSRGCPGASRCTKGASCADDHEMLSGGVITDRTLSCVLDGAPSDDGPRVTLTWVKGSSECGLEESEMALTTL